MLNERLSRRDVLKLAGAGGLGLLLGGGGAYGVMAAQKALARKKGSSAAAAGGRVPFYGSRQAGIVTPAQNFLCLAAFDLTTGSLADVRKLFQAWTEAAAAMAKGAMIGDSNNKLNLPPSDTGEAAGLSPSRLTLTFGVGPSFFDGRFGLAGQRPAAFAGLPAFNGDALQPEWCGGDLSVQVCADDMQVAFHAVRNLARIGRGTAVLRWMQEGFQRTGAADPSAGTPRNLMGFKDGTGNPDASDAAAMNESVWVQPGDGAGWMEGGSYMAVRRIRMRIEIWDRSSLADQEQTFGRYRDTGAPLGSADEFAPLDLAAKDASGQPVLPMTSHTRLAHMDGKIKILRRSYSYTGGIDAKTGQLDAGLIFISFQRNLLQQFVPIQQTLAQSDKLNEYILHIGSAVFACFPGIREGGYIGEQLI
ncbi:deferrochelatase [Paenibacillus macerans]|nr:deferrochelatase [Paenibacillus macerans]